MRTREKELHLIAISSHQDCHIFGRSMSNCVDGPNRKNCPIGNRGHAEVPSLVEYFDLRSKQLIEWQVY